MLSLIIELSISKPTKEGNLKTFWICIILLNALWVFSYSWRETASNELFTGKKIGECLTGKKGNWQIYNYFSVCTLFLSSPLSAAFSLHSPTEPPKLLHSGPLYHMYKADWTGISSRFFLHVKYADLSCRNSGSEIFRSPEIWPTASVTTPKRVYRRSAL